MYGHADHRGHSTSSKARSTLSSCANALTFLSKTSSGIPGGWNCVKTYSEPAAFGMTREPASTSTPGAGEMKKSTTPELGSGSMRMATSPPPAVTHHLPFSCRTLLANPTAHRGKLRGSDKNATTVSGAAFMEIVFV